MFCRNDFGFHSWNRGRAAEIALGISGSSSTLFGPENRFRLYLKAVIVGRGFRRVIIVQKHHQRFACVMSITATEILQAMVYHDGHIEVLRGPTLGYKEYISVCRADGLAMTFSGILSREILNKLVAAKFTKQDGPEDDRMVTIFRLTDEGKARGSPKAKKALTSGPMTR
jgi:hypothetical protein